MSINRFPLMNFRTLPSARLTIIRYFYLTVALREGLS